MARQDGLIRLSDKSEEERKAISSKGGKRSVQVRKERAEAKQAALIALNLKPNIDAKQKSGLKQMGANVDKPLTVLAISMTRVAYRAMNGDLKALRFLLETAHLSPQWIVEFEKLELLKQAADLKKPPTEIEDAEIVTDVDTTKIEGELRKMGIYANG